jgi:hypothetical protein
MISAQAVTQTWQQMAQMPSRQAPEFVERLRKEQPVLLVYLRVAADPFSEHEGGIIFYLGLVVWQMMRRSRRRLRKVTRKKLNRAQADNEDLLEMLASDTDADFVSATQYMLERHPEPEVLRYIIEAIMDEEEYASDDDPIRHEYRGLAFIHLKIALDAPVASLAPKRR